MDQIECANCGTTNPPSHKYCRECGSQLNLTCPNGHANPPGHKFCFECGAALTAGDARETVAPEQSTPAGPSAVETEERRLVTSLFVDLVGFTGFSESRDPEEVRAVLTRYFDTARATIERFGGVVDKFIGDAVTAFWGARVAQEDDAERAVRAALELVDSVAALGDEIGVPDLALRAGVLTGETSVGPGGNATGLVLGDVVNTASRLQSIASPGTVAVGEATVRLTDGAIDYEPLGEQELKGKSQPVPAWRALRVGAARGGRGRVKGLEPPFVGRRDEMRMLKDGLEATKRERRARLISIVGEAGIGKTRLGYEFWKYVDGLAGDVYWHQGRSPSYSGGLTFWALGEMVRQRARIAETDDDHRSRTRLRTAVAEYIPDVDEQRWIEPHLAGLLGVDEMPDSDRTELYAALSTFFQRISERDVTVLLFEDLHWADPGLLTFLDELVERSHRHPILVITLARPELIEREPGWGAVRKNTTATHLGHLPNEDMRALVRGVVPDMGERDVEVLVERASGVPLYAVEMLRMLLAQEDIVETSDGGYALDGELTTLSIPETLQSVIGARIDRLSGDERRLLQDAAVLGLSFTRESLSALSEEQPERLRERLQQLVKRDLLRLESDPASPERGQYRFVQSLIREVAYGRFTHGERRARHLRVADYFETQGGPEVAAVVANHLMAAYRASPDESEAEALAARVTTSLRRTAQRAADLHSNRQVLDICEEALRLGEAGPVQAELLELAAKASSALLLEDEAIDYARRALAWQEEHGNESGRVKATTLLGTVYTEFFHPATAVEVLRPTFDRHAPPDTPEELQLGSALVRALMLNAEHEQVAAVSEQVLVPAEAQEDTLVVVETMNTRGTSLATLGRLQEGIALVERSLQLAEQHDLPLSVLRAHNNLGVLMIQDDHQAALANARAGYEKARSLGDPQYLVRTTVGLSAELIGDGQFDPALRVIDDLEVGEDSPFGRWLDWQKARIAIARSEPDAEARSRAAIAQMRLHEDEPQQRYLNDSVEALIEYAVGDPAVAFDIAIGAPEDFAFPWHLLAAAYAAIRVHDLERLRTVHEALERTAQRGRRITALRRLVQGSIAVLDGRVDEGADVLVECMDLQAKVDLGWQRAEAKALVASLLGPDHPVGRKAAEEFLEWCDQTGATGLAEFYAPAVAKGRTAGSAAG